MTIDWSDINRRLDDGPVLVSITENLTRPLYVQRSSPSPHYLTIDFNGFEIRADEGVCFEGFENGFVTVRRFGTVVTSDWGKGVTIRQGHDLIIEDGSVTRTDAAIGRGDGMCVIVGYSTIQAMSNIALRRLVLEKANGEGIYIGGCENTPGSPQHRNILIEDCTVRDVGMSGSGEGDAIDIKDGILGVTVRRNLLQQTALKTGRDGIATMSGGLYENNTIRGFGRTGMTFSAYWNAVPSRANTKAIGNRIADVGGGSHAWDYGVAVDGQATGDNWEIAFSQNRVERVTGNPGQAFYASKYAKVADDGTNAWGAVAPTPEPEPAPAPAPEPEPLPEQQPAKRPKGKSGKYH